MRTQTQDGVDDITLEASRWFNRLESDDERERADFLLWLRQDPRHVGEFLEIAQLDEELKRCDPERTLDAEAMLQRVQTIISELPNRSHFRQFANERSLRGSSREPTRLRFAAMVAALAGFVAIILTVSHERAPMYETGKGELRLVVLPDGSKVHLNADTRLRLAFKDLARDVELIHGEALFDVVHDAARPFRVTAGDAIAMDIGTRFDVRLEESGTSVLVTEGKVAVMRRTDTKLSTPVELSEGEQARVHSGHDASTIDVRMTEDAGVAALAWALYRLSLIDMTLADAIEQLNRHNVAQVVLDERSLAQSRIGGSIRIDEPEGFVLAVQDLLGSGSGRVIHLESGHVTGEVP